MEAHNLIMAPSSTRVPLSVVHAILTRYSRQWAVRDGVLQHVQPLSAARVARCAQMLKRHHAHRAKAATYCFEMGWTAVMVPPFYNQPLHVFLSTPATSVHAHSMKTYLLDRGLMSPRPPHVVPHPGLVHLEALPKRVIGYYRLARKSGRGAQTMTKVGYRLVCGKVIVFQMEWVLSYCDEPVQEVWPLAYLPMRRHPVN